MMQVKSIAQLDSEMLEKVVTGYVSHAMYSATKMESEDRIDITLDLISLDNPYVKEYDHINEMTLQRYKKLPQHGFCFAAYKADEIAGLCLAEPQHWNNSIWVWEFHVAERFRGKGARIELVEAFVHKASFSGFRTVVCETKNTNFPAIRFY